MNYGLTDEQVEKSREKHGTNSLTQHKRDTFWNKLLANLKDPMIKILCVALIINIVLTLLGKSEWYESVGIAVAVILATLVSTFSEYSNENSFQKLQEEASKIICKVYRNGEVTSISIDEIVVGDDIVLQQGDKIPVDGVVIWGNLSVEQSVLNGESEEAKKIEVSSDYNFDDCEECNDFLDKHHVFRGTVVCSGNAIVKCTTVGDKSVYGKIASELQVSDDRKSPLMIKLSNLASTISKFGYIGGIAIAVVMLFQRLVVHNDFNWAEIIAYCSNFSTLIGDIIDAVILAVIIIVMAVPEGLPLMIAIVSSQNMGKMLKDNVLVRDINGIETAGSLNLLFSDKTGTITKGHLQVINFTTGNGKEYSDFDEVDRPLQDILGLSILENTSAFITKDEHGNRQAIGGNATDRAVLSFIKSDFSTNYDIKKTANIPFSSEYKFAATTVSGDYEYTLLKGAPEKIISKCKWYLDESGNRQPLQNSELIDEKINILANRAIRVLGLAISEKPIIDITLPEDDYTLVGILGIRDEIRKESVSAIQEVQNAGVQVVMITGDRKDTAVAIAREAGLIQKDTDLTWTSDELSKLSDDEVKKHLMNLRVVSRALPSDKSRLVRLAQEENLVVGMTGDGVNDSPALKKADVGFAMGSGTEVAKEASEIVILDDNFNSIDRAILYGRTIFNNIRKFIIFQLTINVAAVLISFIIPLLGIPGIENPLSITQILWVNLIMDTLAALAFGGEPPLQRYMQEKPKRRDESIVNRYMWSQIITTSLWICVIGVLLLATSWGSNFIRADINNKYLLTAFFTFFIFAAVFNSFNARTEKYNVLDNIGKNKTFLYIMGIITIIQIMLTTFGGTIFNCFGLNIKEWIFVLIISLTVIPIDMIRKTFYSLKK